MVIKYTNIYHLKALQIWDFWFKNKPSGNPEFPHLINGTRDPIPFDLPFIPFIIKRFSVGRSQQSINKAKPWSPVSL
jgi:hypothetical protein